MIGRYRYGICSVCGRRMSVTKDGMITTRHAFCEGAGKPPERLLPDGNAFDSEGAVEP